MSNPVAQTKARGGRPLAVVSGLAVAVVLVLSVINLIGALSKGNAPVGGNSSGTLVTTSALNFIVILAAYLLVIARKPSWQRWSYFTVLAVVFGGAVIAAANSSGGVSSHTVTTGTNPIGLLLVAAAVCLPLVYMRLRLPATKS